MSINFWGLGFGMGLNICSMNFCLDISSYSYFWEFLFTIKFTFLCSTGWGFYGGGYSGDFSINIIKFIIESRDYYLKFKIFYDGFWSAYKFIKSKIFTMKNYLCSR